MALNFYSPNSVFESSAPKVTKLPASTKEGQRSASEIANLVFAAEQEYVLARSVYDNARSVTEEVKTLITSALFLQKIRLNHALGKANAEAVEARARLEEATTEKDRIQRVWEVQRDEEAHSAQEFLDYQNSVQSSVVSEDTNVAGGESGLGK